MLYAGRRPMGRLFYLVGTALAACGVLGCGLPAAWAAQSGPATTTVADTIVVNVPSRAASFTAIVRVVGIEVVYPANDRGMYAIEFANDLASPLALESQGNSTTIRLQDMPPRLTTAQVGAYYVTDLREAQITAVTSTTVTVDAGIAPGSTQGIEVRIRDFGWGQTNDRNLLGRFGTQVFTLPRLGTGRQHYYLRMYDTSSGQLRYSRYSMSLNLDYPA